MVVTPPAKTDNNGNVKPSVTFHTVLELPSAGPGGPQDKGGKEGGQKYKKSGVVQSWRNIFQLGQSSSRRPAGGQQELRGSHREINIDDAILPENKPLNYRPRPRSEINLSYSIQVGTGWDIMGTRVLGEINQGLGLMVNYISGQHTLPHPTEEQRVPSEHHQPVQLLAISTKPPQLQQTALCQD